MKTDIDETEGTVAVADETKPEPAPRMRGRDLNAKHITVIGALVGAGAAILLTALTAGSAGSAVVCEQELGAQARAIMAGHDQSGGATPRGCNGIAQAEIDRMAGQIYGRAFAG